MVPLTRGFIRIDGIDLAGEDAHEVRSRLCMIPQDPILFEGSVRENLDPEGKCSEEEIWRALEKACIKDIVAESGGLGEFLMFVKRINGRKSCPKFNLKLPTELLASVLISQRGRVQSQNGCSAFPQRPKSRKRVQT